MITFIIILFGLVIGSFLNVCIYRIPKKITIITKPSHCLNCKKTIMKRDLIPIFSYLILKGKCRFCSCKIPMRYPVIELLNACLYIALYYKYGLTIQFISFAFLSSVLIVISYIDIDYKMIPSKIITLILIVGLFLNLLGDNISIMDSVIGFFIISIPLLIISLLSNGGIGGGDIKLMAVTGFYMGWKLILLSMLIASILGGLFVFILMITKIKKAKDIIAFAPLLSIGMVISILFGQELISFYLKFILR